MKPTGDGRDEAFDRLLGREFSRPATAPDACPQLELLSAWFDRALPAAEAAAVEAHLATCARCQEVLGHLARTEPEVLYVHPKPEPTPWTWHLRWAVPVAAAAVIVFVVGTRSLIAPDTGVPPRTIPAGAVKQMAQNADRVLPSEPAVRADSAVPSGSRAPARDAPLPSGSTAPTTRAASKAKAQAPESSATPPARRKSVPAAPAPVAEERLARQNAEPAAAPAAPPQAAPAKVVTLAPPPAGAEAARELRKVEEARSDSALLLDARLALSGFVPGSPVGWRYARPGLVLRTQDGGLSWTEQPLPTASRLLALSAVSPSVCWAAGAAGTILRTTDGVTWQVMTSPTTADLVSMSALDDHRVTVRTTNGVTYDTGDGGATWRRR